jgi:hypothetical protein
VDHYELVATPVGGGAAVSNLACAVPSSGTTQTCNISGVLANVYYTVVVTAVNASGRASSPASLVSIPILGLSATSVSLNVGTAYAVSPYTVTNSGGTAASYAYTGTLPAGLTFNTSTGGVTGTPSQATNTSGNAIAITALSNTSPAETSAPVTVTIIVTQQVSTPSLYFPQPATVPVATGIPGTGTANYPQYSNGVVSGNGAPLLAVSTNSTTPLKYSLQSNPTLSSQWLTTGTPNSTYVRSTTANSCSLYNLNGVVYVAYYVTSTSSQSSTASCTVYVNQDATTGWNAATQTSKTAYFDKSTTSWGSTAPYSQTSINNSTMSGTVGTPITAYRGTSGANISFGIGYSSSRSSLRYGAMSCSVSPGLPAGLSLDPVFCSISGTPTAISGSSGSPVSYTVTLATLGSGTTTKTFTLYIAGRSQVISFSQGNVASIVSTFQLNGTASSNLSVTYTSSTTGVCQVTSGGLVTPQTSGTCTITAAQAGDSTTWAAAPNVPQTFTLGSNTPVLRLATGTSADATITTLTATPAIISFTDTAGTAVSYKIYDANNTEIPAANLPDGLAFDSTTGILSGAAEVAQAKTAYSIIGYNVNNVASNRLSFTLTILARAQTISWPTMHSMIVGSPDQGLGATSDSGLLVTYSNSTPTVCRVNANGTLTALAVGSCTITATQPGDGKAYLAASPLPQTISIAASLAAPNITLTNNVVTITVGAPFPLPFNTINTGGTASYTISPALPSGLVFDPVYGVIGSSTARTTSALTTYTITATNTGANNTVQNSTATFTLAVVGASQTIGLSGSTSMVIGTNTTQVLTPVLDPVSLLPLTSVTVTTGNPGVCTYDAATRTLTAVAYGTCVLTATQAGNSVYSAATATFTVNVHQAPTLTLTPSSLNVVAGSSITNPFTIATTGDPVRFELHDGSNANISANTINGLTFNTATGQLSGVTTSTLALTNYTIWAINAYGSTSRPFSLTITAALSKVILSFSATDPTVKALTLRGLSVNTAVANAAPIYNTGTQANGFTWTCTVTTPITGMTYSTTTGIYSGTPTAIPGSTNTCTIYGTNSNYPSLSTTADSQLTLTIDSSSVVIGKPQATTGAASGSGTSWTLNGTAGLSGAASGSYYFCYIANANPAVGVDGSITGATCTSSTSFSSNGAVSNSGLTWTAGTVYTYQLKTTNSAVTTYGGLVSFTATAKPVVVTGSSTAVTATSFQVTGTVNNNMADTTLVYICYSTTNPGSGTAFTSSSCPAANQVQLANLSASSSTTTVTGTISGLTAGTTYYYQLVAANASGLLTALQARLQVSELRLRLSSRLTFLRRWEALQLPSQVASTQAALAPHTQFGPIPPRPPLQPRATTHSSAQV